jgi:hypothetical protein
VKAKHYILAGLFFFIPVTFFLQMNLLNSRYGEYKALAECPWCEEQMGDDITYVPLNVSVTRLFSPADPDFLADFLWLRTMYYFGQHALTDRQYPYLFHLLDIITDLSPEWAYPYIFGAVVLPTEADASADGVYIIDKGLVFHPDNWNLWFFKGYYLWKSGDTISAAEAFHKASLCSGAPIYLAKLSATLATRSGQKELGQHFLQESLRNVKTESHRKILLNKMEEVMKSDPDGASME